MDLLEFFVGLLRSPELRIVVDVSCSRADIEVFARAPVAHARVWIARVEPPHLGPGKRLSERPYVERVLTLIVLQANNGPARIVSVRARRDVTTHTLSIFVGSLIVLALVGVEVS